MCKCLYCYQPLKEGQQDFHPACARKMFGNATAPLLPYNRDAVDELAHEVIKARTTVTGVQAKLSLDLNKGGKNEQDRLTIVGLWGRYILKPKSEAYPWLPEDEDLTMHLATIAHIKVVPHSLIRFQNGELAYITRRVDRGDDGTKYLMEDLCQLSERLTSDKYKSSYERVAKVIQQYSSSPLLDLVNYWEVVLFSWITGNSDMHLKNFSLISLSHGLHQLAPAYDLLNVHLIFDDPEELALTIAGKRKRINRSNFAEAMKASGLNDKVIDNIFKKFIKVLPQWNAFIDISFLPDELKEQYEQQITTNIKKLS